MFDPRRNTLASMSESQMNSRLSLVPRSSLVNKTPKSILKGSGNTTNNNHHHNTHNNRLSLAPMNLNNSFNKQQQKSGNNSQLNNSFNTSMNGSMNTSVNKSSNNNNNNNNNEVDTKRICKEIVTYLQQHNFQQEINMKKLLQGGSTDFVNVFEFLLHQLDSSVGFRLLTPNALRKIEAEEAKNRRRTTFQPNQSLAAFQKDHKTSVHGFDEQMFYDIVTYFKYTHTPPAQFLKSSAFTPRGWIKMLSILGWFLDLIKYHGHRMRAREEELTTDDEFMFFTYLKQRYYYFLQGDENGRAQVMNQLKQQAEQTSADVLANIDSMSKQYEGMRRTIEQITAFLSERSKLEQKHADYSRDIHLVSSNIDQLQVEVTDIDNHINTQQLELGHVHRQVSMLTRERDSLRAQIDQQELKPQDVLRMNKQRSSLEDECKRTLHERDSRNQELFHKENEIRAATDHMMKLVGEYNQLSTILPAVTDDDIIDEEDGDYNMESGFELRLSQARVQNELKAIEKMEMESSQPPESNSQDDTQTISSMLNTPECCPLLFSTNIDLYETDHKIRRMKDDLVKSTRTAQEKVYELGEKYDIAEDLRQKEEEQIKELERQLEREKMHLAGNKQDWEKEIQQIYFEIDEIEEEIKKSKNENQILSSTVADTERQIQLLLREQKALEDQHRLEVEEMGKLLIRAAQAVYEHKEHVQTTLTHTAHYRNSVIQGVHEE
jgi:SMC interacting uncharacterized protein involved in chromosome segregation